LIKTSLLIVYYQVEASIHLDGSLLKTQGPSVTFLVFSIDQAMLFYEPIIMKTIVFTGYNIGYVK